MNNREKKKLQKEYAQKNIEFFFSLLKNNFKEDLNKKYIREIQRLSQGFNIRLSREEKLKFCRKCYVSFSVKTREIRLNSQNKTKDIICKNCGDIRRFKY